MVDATTAASRSGRAIPALPASSRQTQKRKNFGDDLFERLVPHQSRRPCGRLAAKMGIPMLHNSSTDKFLHATCVGMVTMLIGVPLGMMMGLSIFVIEIVLLSGFFLYQDYNPNSTLNQPTAID